MRCSSWRPDRFRRPERPKQCGFRLHIINLRHGQISEIRTSRIKFGFSRPNILASLQIEFRAALDLFTEFDDAANGGGVNTYEMELST
jgi:hypothetical protein